jgi:hypothetical protein
VFESRASPDNNNAQNFCFVILEKEFGDEPSCPSSPTFLPDGQDGTQYPAVLNHMILVFYGYLI